MFKTYARVFEHRQYAPAKTQFAVHHRLCDVDRREAFVSGNARNDAPFVRRVVCRHDHRAVVVGVESIANVNRRFRETKRESRFRMQNVRAHIGKFAQFCIRQHVDLFGIFDNVRIGGEKAVDVRPVFVYDCVGSARDDCARDIRAAP